MDFSTYRFFLMVVVMSLLVSVQAQKKKAGPPRNIRSPGSTPSSIDLEWEPPKKLPPRTSVDGYKVLFRLAGSAQQKKLDVPDTQSYTVSDLAPGSTYQFKMATLTSNGKVGGFTSWQSFQTAAAPAVPPPNPPQNVRAGAMGTSIVMEWVPPDGAFDGYVVGYGLNSAEENTLEVSQEELGTTISGLEAGAEYQVSLQSVRDGIRSQPLSVQIQTGVPVPSPPGGIRLRASSDSIDVEWSHNRVEEEGVTGFELNVGPDSNPTEQTISLDSSDRYTTVTGLNPNQVYVVSVKAQNQYGNSQPIADKISTQAARRRGPAPPTGMQMRPTSDSVDVYWGAPSTPVDYYILNVGPPDNPTQFTERIPSGTTNFRQTGLQPDSDYIVSIRSVNADGESQPLNQPIRTAPSQARRPMPPSGARMQARSDSIELMWGEAPGDVTGYRVEAGPASNPSQYSQELPPGTTSHTIPELEPNTEYQVSLMSVSENGESQPLRQVIRTTNISPPSSISLQGSDRQIAVRWPPAQENIDGYNLRVTRTSRPDDVVYQETLSREDSDAVVRNLEPNTDYTVSMTSFRGDSTSLPIQQNVRTLASRPDQDGLPDSPSGVNVASEGNNLRVRWNQVQGASGYMIRAGRASTGATNEVEERVNSRKSEYLLRNLEPGQDYLVSVSAMSDRGESNPTLVTARTDAPLPGRPEGLVAETTPTTATLSWRSPGTPIDGYTLSLGTVTYPNQFNENLRGRATSFTFRDLEPDTIYQAELQSYNEVGSSQPITTKLRTEPAPASEPPPAPGRMGLTSTPSRINIRWQPAQGAVTGYRIRISDPSTGETNTVEVDQFQQNYAFTDLMPGKEYEVSIEAFNGDGYSEPVVQTVSTDPLPRGSNLPQNVDVVATGTQIDAHWNPPILPRGQNPHSYNLVAEAVDTEGNPLGPRESITLHHSQNSHTFYGLQPATIYRVSVAANIDGEVSRPVVREVTTSIDGPIPPINIMAEPVSPTAIDVSWDFPVATGPPEESNGRRPDIYYTVRARNPEAGDIYANSREMSATVEGLRPDTLYEISVAMVFNGLLSDYGEAFAVRTFSDVDPRSPQFPTVTQVVLGIPENVHATFNWLPPREDANNIRSYNLEYTMEEDPSLENTTWASKLASVNDLGVVVSDLRTNGIVTYRVQPVYRGGEKGPFSPLAAFSTPVAERPTPADQPCQSHEDVTRQRINQITERVVPPLGMPLPYCDQFFTDFPCVWSPVCLCIPRGTNGLGTLPTSVRHSDGPGCSESRRRDDPSATYSDEPEVPSGPAPCQLVFDTTMEALKASLENGMPLMSSALPDCREDGYFEDIQCMGTMCICVNEMGKPTGKMTQVWNVKNLVCS